MIKLHEGLRLFPYQDSQGFLSVGYGHNLSARGITRGQAENILTDDIFEAEASLVRSFPWVEVLDEVRRAVLVDLTFNIGIAGVAKFKTTLGLIKDGDYGGASKAMLESLWARQVGSRATRLSNMMRDGRWPIV
jgi:lysozyme